MVTVVTSPADFHQEDLYVDLRQTLGRSLHLKVEGLNLAGSVKLKPAAEMVAAAEREGILGRDSILIESSSGNLGVALSMIAASKGYRFVCVTDARCSPSSLRMMRALGAEVRLVRSPHPERGLLGARIDLVRSLCAADRRYVWLDQYRSADNWRSHYHRTAPSILRQFPDLDVLFVGTGTGGTLMGCARYLRERRPGARIVAVDVVGSVSFGGAPGRRMIPGLGTSMVPPLLDRSRVDDVVRVDEADTIRACRRLAAGGFLFGGSTGTVVSGALTWLAEADGDDLTAVAIAPDLGERYLDTVYDERWVSEKYGDQGLGPAETRPRIRSA